MRLTKEINDFYYHMALYELQVMNGGDLYNGLSYNSTLYLNVINLMEDCTASKIAKALKISKPAVTLKLNELEKLGIIVKEKSEKDRRVTYIRISPDMARVVSIYDQVFDKIETDLCHLYTREQLHTFSEILHTISGYEWRNVCHGK